LKILFLLKLEEKISLDAFHELNQLFNEADSDGSGSLDLEEFKSVVKGALKIEGRVCKF
jgi:Ca2+-binding EF-hand superfamily protein